MWACPPCQNQRSSAKTAFQKCGNTEHTGIVCAIDKNTECWLCWTAASLTASTSGLQQLADPEPQQPPPTAPKTAPAPGWPAQLLLACGCMEPLSPCAGWPKPFGIRLMQAAGSHCWWNNRHAWEVTPPLSLYYSSLLNTNCGLKHYYKHGSATIYTGVAVSHLQQLVNSKCFTWDIKGHKESRAPPGR